MHVCDALGDFSSETDLSYVYETQRKSRTVFSQTNYTAYTETLLSFPRKDLLRTASIKRKLHIGRSLLAHLLLIIQNFRAIRSLHLLRIR